MTGHFTSHSPAKEQAWVLQATLPAIYCWPLPGLAWHGENRSLPWQREAGPGGHTHCLHQLLSLPEGPQYGEKGAGTTQLPRGRGWAIPRHLRFVSVQLLQPAAQASRLTVINIKFKALWETDSVFLCCLICTYYHSVKYYFLLNAWHRNSFKINILYYTLYQVYAEIFINMSCDCLCRNLFKFIPFCCLFCGNFYWWISFVGTINEFIQIWYYSLLLHYHYSPKYYTGTWRFFFLSSACVIYKHHCL